MCESIQLYYDNHSHNHSNNDPNDDPIKTNAHANSNGNASANANANVPVNDDASWVHVWQPMHVCWCCYLSDHQLDNDSSRQLKTTTLFTSQHKEKAASKHN